MGKSLGAAGESRDVHNLSPAGQRSVAFCIEVRGLTGAWRRRWVYQSYSYTTLSREPWVTLNYCQLLKPGPVPVAFMLSVVLLTNTRRAPGSVSARCRVYNPNIQLQVSSAGMETNWILRGQEKQKQ